MNLATLLKNKQDRASWHWLMQRATAIVLIPLTFQLLILLRMVLHSPYMETVTWLQMPLNRFGIGLWLIIVCYHAAMGLQVVLEDYVGDQKLQHNLIKTLNGLFAALAVIALFLLVRVG